MKDTYKTIKCEKIHVLFKDKNSKFYAYAYPISSIEDIKIRLLELKKEHPSAGHHCYAYKLGTEEIKHKVSDDGEPNNSAGMPIYGQLQSFELTNILLVVVRYFGGTKLGVSGLINAYRTAAKMAIEQSTIIENTINVKFRLVFDYKHMSKVMSIIKKNKVKIINQMLKENCVLEISVRKGNGNEIFELFTSYYGVQIDEL